MNYSKKMFGLILFISITLFNLSAFLNAMAPKKTIIENKTDNTIKTALFKAIELPSTENVKKLLSIKNIDFDEFKQNGKTLFEHAINKYFSVKTDQEKENILDIITIIIKNPSINIVNKKQLENILLNAIRNGSIKIVKKLITEKIVDSHNLELKYLTPLSQAINSYNNSKNETEKNQIFEIIKFLIEENNQFDTRYNTIQDKKTEAYKYLSLKNETLLLKKIKMLKLEKKELEKIFFLSIKHGYLEIIKQIIKKNLVNSELIISYPQSDTPLKTAIDSYNLEPDENIRSKIFEIIKLLVEKGNCINAENAIISDTGSKAYKYLLTKGIYND